ncbi:hypothetical protein TrispH2_009449 [Trichoplax sp. H2]|nr:hypothetical protein TrispH2_009449 [Trichoplax sp. H2]|eukprot:RDD38861.1 hypothetical protein TrispH2_009449 [Trichoplax sp. H2]
MTTTNVQIYKYTERDPQNHEESATTVAGNATYSDPNIRLKELGIVFNNNYESGFSSIAIENTNCNNPIHQPTRTIADVTVPQSGQNHRICLLCKFVIGFASVQILIAILGLIINPCPIGSLSISLNLYYVTYWTAGPVLILAIVALIINKKEQQSSRNVKIQSWLVVIIILCLLGQDAILGTFLYGLTRFGISWFCNGILSRSMFIGFNIGVLVIQFSVGMFYCYFSLLVAKSLKFRSLPQSSIQRASEPPSELHCNDCAYSVLSDLCCIGKTS